LTEKSIVKKPENKKNQMVLAELGGRIAHAIANMRNSDNISEEVVDEMLKEIGNALVSADVQFQLVAKLKKNIKNQINLSELAVGVNKRKIVQKV
jgi:signal recognition particle subunit SRP54